MNIQTRPGNAIVETANGTLCGVTQNGIHSFKGIPYGASTAGARRFLRPRRPYPGQACATPASSARARRSRKAWSARPTPGSATAGRPARTASC